MSLDPGKNLSDHRVEGGLGEGGDKKGKQGEEGGGCEVVQAGSGGDWN